MKQNLLEIAETHYKNADYETALSFLNAFLKEHKKDEKALVLTANSYDFLGQKKQAIKYYLQALKCFPTSKAVLGNLAIIYYELKDFELSEKFAQKLCELDSKNHSANVVLGNIYYQKREYQKALEFYLLSYDEKKYVSCINLANTYVELKNFLEAEKYALKAQELSAQKAMSFSVLGNIYKELGKDDEAILNLKKAIELDPSDAWSCNYLSQIFQNQEAYQNAIDYAYQAILRSPKTDNSHHINLGYLLYEVFEFEPKLCQKTTHRWLSDFSQNEVVTYMANALLKNENQTRANDEYLKNIFDVFAEDFETVLANLDYKAPEYVAEALEKIYEKNPKQNLTILDAGCGTGLCAIFLKKYAKKSGLHGVDISSKMLDVAARKKLYDKLFSQELVVFLKQHKKTYDLIVSSDVFTYFGALEALFEMLFFGLKKEGKLVFTISKNRVNEDKYFLHSSGRFLHHKDYVMETLEKSGFRIETFSEHILRKEGSEKVEGYLVSAVKNLSLPKRF
ncbi:MAG: tetratricopeptide repeat protein [Alphaproteobacteria bacterium]|nr:tetratricopeptide repeat protein [Alphaproteobacteria bacterium]